MKIRVRLFAACQAASSLASAEVEVDELYFGARRVRAKRGRGALGKHIVGFNLLDKTVYSPALKRGELPAKKYQTGAFETGQEQIALAGYRLAETFNQIFGSR